jgi:hypothetical protein
MVDDENSESEALYTPEDVLPAHAEPISPALVPPGWRGPISALDGHALQAFWGEAVRYARWEIGRYACWRMQDEPVLADGYDAEGVTQAAFQRLLLREAGSVPILYSAEDIRHELLMLIKHRVRWLHERSETRLVVSEWDILAPRPDGELVSIFKYLPGRIPRPDVELMRKEKEQLIGEFKAGFEATLGKRHELLEVFERAWDGKKRQEIACELGVKVERVKTLQAQLRRRLTKFGAALGEEVVQVLTE